MENEETKEETTPEEETPKEVKEETEEPEKTTEPEKAEKSKEFQTLDAQKRYWRERAQKAEAKEQKPEPKKPSDEEDTGFWKAKVDFLIQNQDKKYSEDEFDHIATVAARKGVSLPEAAKSENGYIDFQREKVAEKNKIPGPGSSSSFTSIEKTSEEIAAMTSDEHRLYEAKIIKERTGQGV